MEHRFTPEALAGLAGKKVPVTIEVNGEKQVIGEAIFVVDSGELKFDATIKSGFEGLVAAEGRHFSIANDDPMFGR
jgi:hypothetical protein